MIKIAQPAMALNSHDVPAPWYQMTNTRLVAKGESPQWVLSNVASVFKDFTKRFPGQNRTLIINCHGGSGGLSLGSGIGAADTVHFAKLAGLVDEILIVACQAAGIVGKTPTDNFTGAIARRARAKVMAAVNNQDVDTDVLKTSQWMPFGFIDDWEGPVLVYDNSGNVADITVSGKSIVGKP